MSVLSEVDEVLKYFQFALPSTLGSHFRHQQVFQQVVDDVLRILRGHAVTSDDKRHILLRWILHAAMSWCNSLSSSSSSSISKGLSPPSLQVGSLLRLFRNVVENVVGEGTKYDSDVEDINFVKDSLTSLVYDESVSILARCAIAWVLEVYFPLPPHLVSNDDATTTFSHLIHQSASPTNRQTALLSFLKMVREHPTAVLEQSVLNCLFQCVFDRSVSIRRVALSHLDQVHALGINDWHNRMTHILQYSLVVCNSDKMLRFMLNQSLTNSHDIKEIIAFFNAHNTEICLFDDPQVEALIRHTIRDWLA
eukprot:PhF_6_TR9422/c0_g1_i1/m.14735